MSETKVVIIYSGGMDSFTLLNELDYYGAEVHAISFNYGQRHAKELVYAHNWTRKLGLSHHVIDLTCLNPLLQGSSLTSDIDVPEGHYSEENMKATVVPNRNMIMLSIAVGYAVSIGASEVYTAVHAGDHDIYPDCRKEFIDAMDEVTQISNYMPVGIKAPYLDMDKANILFNGDGIGLRPIDYINSWTCYAGGDKACGKCGACVERLEAFDKVGWDDPLHYEDREFWKEAVANAQ